MRPPNATTSSYMPDGSLNWQMLSERLGECYTRMGFSFGCVFFVVFGLKDLLKARPRIGSIRSVP